MAIFWVLNLSDSQHDLLDIAVRSGLGFDSISRAARLLREAELLKSI
jgi:aminopeptidase-like protein